MYFVFQDNAYNVEVQWLSPDWAVLSTHCSAPVIKEFVILKWRKVFPCLCQSQCGH